MLGFSLSGGSVSHTAFSSIGFSSMPFCWDLFLGGGNSAPKGSSKKNDYILDCWSSIYPSLLPIKNNRKGLLFLNKISSSRSGKLYFYSNILNHADYKLQDYLKFPLKKHQRSQLTKLRISAHSLLIEAGRYCKPIIPKEKRFCYNCKLMVENEKHFVLYCPVYDNLR
jgi:hypothetical protein